MSHRILERIEMNARGLMDTYPNANALLSDAMKETVPWAMALMSQKRVPNLAQLERLATQVVAILLASSHDKGGDDNDAR